MDIATYALKQILDSLPKNRDWLDPFVERIGRGCVQDAPAETLSFLLDQKTVTEKRINVRLEQMFPEGARVTYMTWGMKHERWATVSRASLYCGSPYVCLYPDHNPKKLRRICAGYVSPTT